MVKMNISLRKRDADAVLVQLLLGLLGQVAPDAGNFFIPRATRKSVPYFTTGADLVAQILL